MSTDQRVTIERLRDDVRALSKEIGHVEGALQLITKERDDLHAELTRTHHELGQARNAVSQQHAADAHRRALHSDARIRTNKLLEAIDTSSAGFEDKALLRQGLVHLWALCERAAGV